MTIQWVLLLLYNDGRIVWLILVYYATKLYIYYIPTYTSHAHAEQRILSPPSTLIRHIDKHWSEQDTKPNQIDFPQTKNIKPYYD